jgi:hypothetical protein
MRACHAQINADVLAATTQATTFITTLIATCGILYKVRGAVVCGAFMYCHPSHVLKRVEDSPSSASC